MNPIEHFECPHLALWKSCVAEVLAKHTGEAGHAAGIDTGHPMMQGTDRYCRLMLNNRPIEKPPADSDEVAVHAYLSYLHHRRAHAKIADDARLEADIERQTQEYKYGNPLWQQMYIQYFEYYWQYPYHKGEKPHYRSWQAPEWGRGDRQYGVIQWKLPARARVAIVGDIGTGTDVAAAVLVAALQFKPDAILHVGDIYYSGTPFETTHRLVGLVRSVLHSDRARVPFFTVPGNHEYFTGAVSYLRALDSDKLIAQPSQRQVASYFCLRTEDDGWQFLGMDTGYHGHYMNVPPAAQQAALERLHLGKVSEPACAGDPHWPAHNPYFRSAGRADLPVKDTTAQSQVVVRPDELAWHLDKLSSFPGRSILLSHHQLYSAHDPVGTAQRQRTGADGKTALDPTDINREWINTGLWRQFGPTFGDRVAAWIWGHEDNLDIYQDGYRPADWPTTGEAVEIFKTLPKGRCCGHSAIPVAQTETPYKQNYPVPLARHDLELDLTAGYYNHGFELLELAGAGQPARLSYFQVAGADPTPLPIYVEQVV
ncbi:MAG TPA: metallophosphoesterase [Kofleriaceae bacterium]